MVERYEIEEISKIWSSQNKFRRWLDVELAISEVWYRWGEVPEKSYKNIEEKANFDVERINEIEKNVKHDVIALSLVPFPRQCISLRGNNGIAFFGFNICLTAYFHQEIFLQIVLKKRP